MESQAKPTKCDDPASPAEPEYEAWLDFACAINIGKCHGSEMEEAAAQHLEAGLRKVIREELAAALRSNDLIAAGPPISISDPVKYSRDWSVTPGELRRREEDAGGQFIPAESDEEPPLLAVCIEWVAALIWLIIGWIRRRVSGRGAPRAASDQTPTIREL